MILYYYKKRYHHIIYKCLLTKALTTNQTTFLWNIVWKQELNLQSLNLFFSIKAQAISKYNFQTTMYLSWEPQPGPRSNVESNQNQTGIFQEINNKWKSTSSGFIPNDWIQKKKFYPHTCHKAYMLLYNSHCIN